MERAIYHPMALCLIWLLIVGCQPSLETADQQNEKTSTVVSETPNLGPPKPEPPYPESPNPDPLKPAQLETSAMHVSFTLHPIPPASYSILCRGLIQSESGILFRGSFESYSGVLLNLIQES